MPTIDQLAPATSASDSDEFIVSQAGIARKITRAQVLNGVQAQLVVPGGALLGGVGKGSGAPQAIAVGQNLSLNGSTLSATASPFLVGTLQPGNVPGSGDLVPMSQGGTTVAVTYAQLLNGISGVSNINLSQGLVTPAGATTSQTLSNLAANVLPLAGGTLTGSLSLSGVPVASQHAANKAYVDQTAATLLPMTGGSMSGILTLSASPRNPLDSATKGYVDTVGSTMLATSGGSLSGALLLAGDPTSAVQASTMRYTDLKVARTGDTLSGLLTLSADPVSGLQAATKNYVDKQVANSLPNSGGTLVGALVLGSDPTIAAQAATKQYVDQRIMRSGDTFSGPLALAGDPLLAFQAATKNYVDAQSGLSVLRTGSSMSGALLLASDPATAFQASTKQYVDLRLARTGDTLTGALYLAADPIAPLHAATKQYTDSQFAKTVSSTGATFSGPILLAADPLVPAQAATKQYADTKLSRAGDTLSGALVLAFDPVIGPQAATKNYVDITSLPRIGGSLTGPLALATDPVLPGQAATKRYVDSQVGSSLPISGGSLTGFLSLPSAPAAAQHAATKQYVDSQLGLALPVSGGTVTGALTLAGVPTVPLHAATKSYVDTNPDFRGVINVAMQPFGAKLDGVTDDTAAFKAAYQAAPAGSVIYVPNGKTVVRQPNTWGIPLPLTKRVKWVVDGTVWSDGTPLASAVPTGGNPAAFVLPGFVGGNTPYGLATSQGASQTTDFAVTQSSYIVNHSGGDAGTVLCNVRADTIIYSSPGNYVWGGLDRLVWAGQQTPSGAPAAQHVGRYVQTVRQSAATDPATGLPLPQPQLWAACLEYRDKTGQPSSATAAALTVEMDWFGNGLDDANVRTIQSLVVGQDNKSGAPVEVANVIGVYLGSGSTGSAKTVFGIGIPFSVAVLDTTFARSINNAPVIKMVAGQAIAFEKTNSNRLAFDSSTNTLRWNQGSLSYPVGKGIAVGSANVYSSSAALPNYISGNLIVLGGTTAYSITLPLASTVAAGTGFTFSVTGTAPVNIVPSGTDGIDSGPTIVLHTSDRYHIVSDGSGNWREIFWTNAVSPRFLGPLVLPSYAVSTLPSGVTAGAKAFASNGRKPAENTGSGTGVEVFFDGQRWISSCSGSAVVA
jgi:hypothetical protein